MPKELWFFLGGCLYLLAAVVSLLYGQDVRRWWRRRKIRATIEREQEASDPVRLQQAELVAAQSLAAEQSQRAARFCERYAADLIESGVKPKDAYAEAMAVYQNEVG